MFRLIFGVSGLLVALGLSIAPVRAQALEPGIDHWGGDFREVDLTPVPPVTLLTLTGECSDACESDSQCQAWTLVPAGQQGPNAKCWLKSTVPPPDACNGCVSGVKGPYEAGIDRPGEDYKNFDLTSSNPALCLNACTGDRECSAWTYVNPGVQGPNPRCWLKNNIPTAKISSCCTSGITQAPPVVR